jgi:ADP-dependent NAD(P)H-hydrate dehydratase
MTSSLPAETRITPPVELTAALVRSWALPSDPDDGKFERGTAMVVGGTSRTAGSVLLSGEAALRVGAGRVQIATVESAVPALMAAAPEALVESLPSLPQGSVDASRLPEGFLHLLSDASAVLIGPGTEEVHHTAALLAKLLPRIGAEAVVVVDAAALAAMARLDRTTLQPFRGRLVLTPNRTEAEQLTTSPGDGWAAATSIAHSEGAVVSMDGFVTGPDGRKWLAGERLPGLGTSGSGDILAGLAVGAAARCGDPAQAACWATYLHVSSGKEAAQRIGPLGFLARELLAQVPRLMANAMDSGVGSRET